MINSENAKQKTSFALKWSFFAEIIGKIAVPLTNMILAHILAPEAFGIIATITIVVSFAEIFTDSGFSQYIIQHDFPCEKPLHEGANVAFWSNLLLSFFVFIPVVIFRDRLSALVGSPGYGLLLAVSAVQIPLYGFNSIQTAMLRRDFQFKKLFLVRIVAVLIPLFLSTILALLGFSYWAIAISNIANIAIQATVLFFVSPWRPKLFFSFSTLKKMLSFSVGNMVENLLVWMTASLDIIIIAQVFSQDIVGIYKNAYSTQASIYRLLTAIFTPVLFSLLSRLKNDNIAFQKTLFSFQKNVTFILIPIGTGILLFQDFLTYIFFGNGWEQAAIVIGAFAIVDAFVISINNFASIVYLSKGKPFFSVLTQVIYLIILIPVCTISSSYGFETFVLSRVASRVILIFISLLFLCLFFKVDIWKMLSNLLGPIFSSAIMFVSGFFLKQINDSLVWSSISILLCALIYFLVYFVFFKKAFYEAIHFLIPKKRQTDTTDQ